MEIQNALENLNQQQLLQLLSNEIGFRFEIPDILTFLDDDYFLGGVYFDKTNKQSRIYPMWRERLQDLYPNNITTKSSYVTVSGCIGSGKSTFSSIILMYDYLKLLAMVDPGQFFGLINITGIWLYGCSIYSYKADQFINPITEILCKCPFINDLKKKGQFNDNIKIAPAYGKKSIVSTDAAVIWLSEVNEYKNPNDVISSALSRMTGRFQKGMGIFTHFILDCSDTTIDSATETFIHNSPYSKDVVSYKADIWSVKPQLYWHLEPKGFQVYAGDSVVSPHIVASNEDISTYDEDRLLYVPSELRSNYEIDINKALQETAGVSLISGGMFFPNDSIKKYFCLPQKIKDTEIVDFYDSTRIIDLDNMLELIESLPTQRYLFVGLDAGYATDHYGIAIGYADTVINREQDKENEGTKDFYVKIPVIFGLSRKQGQETNISKVRDFLYKINEVRPIKMVAYDNFQTVQLAQEMEMIGIKAKYISVEQDKHYILFKHGLAEGKIQLANNELLYKEFRCLKHIGDHIDHSNIEAINNTAQKVGINSKDIADATVRCYSAIREHLDLAVDIPLENTSYQNELWGNMVNNMTRQREIEKQSSMNSIYNQKLNNASKNALLKKMW